MKPQKEKQTVSEIMEFPEALIDVGNLLLFGWVILDGVGFGLINVGAGVALFILELIVVYVVLKFVGCLRECWHCKRCTRGFGRMAALYFGKRSLKDPRKPTASPQPSFSTSS